MTDSPAPVSFEDLLNMDVALMKAQFKRLFDRHSAHEQLRPRDYETMAYLKAEIARREASAATAPSAEHPHQQNSPLSLANLLRVTEYLQSQGYKVRKSSIYKHAAAGLIPRAPDGTYNSAAIDTYAAANLKRISSPAASATAQNAPANLSDIQRISEESARAELRRRQAQAALLERKASILEGSFISLSTHEQEISARAARLWADFQNFVHADLPAVIPLVSGDPVHIPEMIEYVLASGARWFARYDSPEEFVVRKEELDAVNAILNGSDADAAAADLDADLTSHGASSL